MARNKMEVQKKNKKKGAPKGNEFWRLVTQPTGRPKKYTPASLWKKAQQYFEWVTIHPQYEVKVFSNGYRTKVKRLRPMTEAAFCLFAGIDENTFQRYKGNENYKDFWAVSDVVSKIIYQQKFEGAAVDFFNANIIARDLGLMDRQKFEFDYENMPEELLDKLIQAHIEHAKKNAK
jgi:hypothetical protein